MRVLVTGGSGFIGTNFIERCVSLDYEVLSLDVNPPQKRAHDSFFLKCDINNQEKLLAAFEEFKPCYVIHLAARTDLEGRSLGDYASNILGVKNVCDAVSNCKSVKKVVFASSMLVCKAGYSPSSTQDFNPTTIYGQSKVQTEKIIRGAKTLPDFCIVRPTSIWGPYFKEPYKNFFDIVLANRFLHPGRKAAVKTYGYVENSVNQLISLMLSDHNHADSLIYLGDEPALNISDWANQIAGLAGLLRPPVIALGIFKLLAYLGDSFKLIGVSFPMTSFRLNNMTTNNILDCSIVRVINQFDSLSTKEGIIRTLEWLEQKEEVK